VVVVGLCQAKTTCCISRQEEEEEEERPSRLLMMMMMIGEEIHKDGGGDTSLFHHHLLILDTHTTVRDRNPSSHLLFSSLFKYDSISRDDGVSLCALALVFLIAFESTDC
jgi:hypothetical protein